MPKPRPGIPKPIRESVLKEYNHRCAKCSADRPQIHHIDENRENNDPLNLIPLCPNCHLTDQHDASNQIPLPKLRVFRRHKHRNILQPQFNAILRRLQRTFGPDVDNLETFIRRYEELCSLIRHLNTGGLFAEQIEALLKPEPKYMPSVRRSAEERQGEVELEMETHRVRLDLGGARARVEELIVELLDFQVWNDRRTTLDRQS